MLSRFFIDRPIFSGVLAIIVMALGIFSMMNLPVERYPDIAPPVISISSSYPGASAETVEESVTQILEQQLRGIDNLLYFSSSSDSIGSSRISLSFKNGTNPDTAQVQVQNTMSSVLNRLPDAVQRQGVRVVKSSGDSLLLVGLYDETGRSSNVEIADYLMNHFDEPIARLSGVGETRLFGSQYAMRIWLNPIAMSKYNVIVSDIQTAIREQNNQVTAGQLGELPNSDEQYLNVTVTAGTRFNSVEEFQNIILKANAQGGHVYLKDVARVELGAENYQSMARMNGYPSGAISVTLASGANALETSQLIKQEIQRLAEDLPAGYKVAYPRDSTPFIEESIKHVVLTLFEAILLVVLVMYVFLQTWRATLIPAVAVPIVILGTFFVLYVLGLSINTLTLFAMVLAIGLLVDDAIVVVENVERLMHEKNLDAKTASIVSMQELSSALFGITLVIVAVFIPMAFFQGSSGVIYRQFSLTLVSAMALSLLVALTITPALCAQFLKLKQKDSAWSRGFHHLIEQFKAKYLSLLQSAMPWKLKYMVILLIFSGFISWIYSTLPSSFLPEEDQGALTIQFRLPEGSPMPRTVAVANQINAYFQEHEKNNIQDILLVSGRNNSGAGQNLGQGFIALKHWDERSAAKDSASAIRQRAMHHFKNHPDAIINIMMMPSVRGLGQSGGLDFWLQDRNGQGRAFLNESYLSLQQKLKNSLWVENIEKVTNDDKAQLVLKINDRVATSYGVSRSTINSTLASAWGSSYVNDFIDRGRVKRVIMQGDAPFRSKPEDLSYWSVRSQTGQMIPFSSFAEAEWGGGPQLMARYNGYSAFQMRADTTDHATSGQAMQAVQQAVDQIPHLGLQWSGLSYQEQQSGRQALWLYVVSIFFIFLCLAALYESWSIPFAVICAIPLGIGGNIIFAWLFSLPNDIYFQIALLTIMGLSCKNAILMIEYTVFARQQGVSVVLAALQGARLRLRPILMTSLAFGAGVLPLVFAQGAGAVSRQEIGLSILGGVIFGTLFVLFFIPLVYVVIANIFHTQKTKRID